jgi:hypothetical protein
VIVLYTNVSVRDNLAQARRITLTTAPSLATSCGPVDRYPFRFACLDRIRRLDEDSTRLAVPDLKCRFVGFEG